MIQGKHQCWDFKEDHCPLLAEGYFRIFISLRSDKTGQVFNSKELATTYCELCGNQTIFEDGWMPCKAERNTITNLNRIINIQSNVILIFSVINFMIIFVRYIKLR